MPVGSIRAAALGSSGRISQRRLIRNDARLCRVFKQSLAEAGFTEGRTVAIEYRWADGHNDRLPELAEHLVRRGVAVIVVGASTPGSLAAKAATQTIPIIFFIGTDPIKVGLVPSLAHPGGNVTGVTALNVELIAKSLELTYSLMPPDTKIGVLINPSNAPQSATERGIIQDVARVLDAHFLILTATSPEEIEAAFATIARERAGALVVSGENFFLTQRDLLVGLAARHAVPSVYAYREFVLAGGLLSYGTHYVDAFHQVGANTGRILKGENPPICRCSKLRRSNLPSISRPPRRLASRFPCRCLAAPKR